MSLVAVAFVRDLDPQFFGASEEVAFGGEACTCGRATHFVGSVKITINVHKGTVGKVVLGVEEFIRWP